MPYTEVTKDNLNDLVENSDTLVVDFWAPWCAPCRMFAPVFEKVSEEYPDVTFAKCNTEDEPEVAGALQIQAIPTLMIFRDQILIFRQAGALPEPTFRDLMQKVVELDMDEVRREIEAEKAAGNA